MKIIYSANIGGYDKFNEPKVYDKDVRYILFTDNKYYKSKVWEVCHLDFINELYDNRKKARFIKINPHLVLPNHEISIWIDHNLIPNFSDTNKMLLDINFNESNIMSYKHRFRNCVYDEAKKVLELKKERLEVVKKQIQRYEIEGFPKNYGLFETGFTFRKNNELVKKFNEFWWNEIDNESGRDQLSQMYICWKHGFNIDSINYGNSQYSNPFLETTLHEKELKF